MTTQGPPILNIVLNRFLPNNEKNNDKIKIYNILNLNIFDIFGENVIDVNIYELIFLIEHSGASLSSFSNH